MDYEAMTVGGLEALNQELMAQKEAVREQQLAVTAAIDAKLAAERAVDPVASVSTQVLVEALKARGEVGGLS